MLHLFAAALLFNLLRTVRKVIASFTSAAFVLQLFVTQPATEIKVFTGLL